MVLWRPYRALEKATHHGGLRGRNDGGRAGHLLVLSRPQLPRMVVPSYLFPTAGAWQSTLDALWYRYHGV